jgi:hypothetical protein
MDWSSVITVYSIYMCMTIFVLPIPSIAAPLGPNDCSEALTNGLRMRRQAETNRQLRNGVGLDFLTLNPKDFSEEELLLIGKIEKGLG